MPSILLTRPQASSEALAHELQDHGYHGIIEPLLSIVPAPSPLPDISACQAVMITSANALYGLRQLGYTAETFAGLPCFCVGSHTGDQARAFGFRHIKSASGGGAELAHLIAKTLTDKSKSVLHIAGQDIDSKAQDELQRLGLSVVPWVIYMAMAATKLSDHTARLLQQREIDAVLFFSARTAETFQALIRQHALEACCEGLIAIGLSEAVTLPLKPISWKKLAASPQPTEESVIACLTEILPVS